MIPAYPQPVFSYASDGVCDSACHPRHLLARVADAVVWQASSPRGLPHPHVGTSSTIRPNPAPLRRPLRATQGNRKLHGNALAPTFCADARRVCSRIAAEAAKFPSWSRQNAAAHPSLFPPSRAWCSSLRIKRAQVFDRVGCCPANDGSKPEQEIGCDSRQDAEAKRPREGLLLLANDLLDLCDL